MKKALFNIFIASIIVKILGFLRELVLSYFYGASYITDAFLMAVSLPDIILGVVITGITISYVPVLCEIEKKEGKQRGIECTNNLILLMYIAITAVVLFVIFNTSFIINLLFPNMEEKTFNLTVSFMKGTIFSLYIQSIITVFSGYLQANNKFFIGSMMSFPLHICVIVGIYMSYILKNRYIMIIGVLLGNICSAVILAMAAKKCGYLFRTKFRMKDEGLKKIFKLSIPIILGVAVNSVNTLVDRILASGILVGGISALSYGNQLVTFIQNIFVNTITTILFPNFAKLKLDNDLNKIKTYMCITIELTIIILVPIIIGGIVLSKPIIEFLYGRGMFDNKAVELTALSFCGYLIGVLAFGFREIMTKVFYAFQDTKKVMINSVIGIVSNIVLNILLTKLWGIFGLAVASSISSFIISVLLLFSFVKQYGAIDLYKLLNVFIVTCICGGVMGIICRYMFKEAFLNFSNELKMCIVIILSALIYFSLILISSRNIRNFFNIIIKHRTKE